MKWLPLLLISSVLLGFTIDTSEIPKKPKKPVINHIKFGQITINKKKYDHDVVIVNGEIKKRDKGPSKAHKKGGHTPLSIHEYIPWDCKTLLIGIGMSSRLPVHDEVLEEAKRRNIEVILLKTPDAVKYFNENYSEDMNAIIHITC